MSRTSLCARHLVNVVVQPWTEKLSLAEDALGPKGSQGFTQRMAARNLQQMQSAAAQVVQVLDANPKRFDKVTAARMRFIGETNIANVSAVKNLAAMGKRNVYTYHGSRSGLEAILPGIKIHVLGPPTLRQSDAIHRQRTRDPDEYWHLQFKRLANDGSLVQETAPIFPSSVHRKGTKLPQSTRWLAHRIREIEQEQLMGIATQLDKQLNNTSLILLFESQKKKLLFSGDAQIENWSVSLAKDKYRKLLADVDLYKVGHHGSLNATPKTLWNGFKKKHANDALGRLKTVLSTMPDKHGSESARTEVPRKLLLAELEAKSDLHSTDALGSRDLFECIDIAL